MIVNGLRGYLAKTVHEVPVGQRVGKSGRGIEEVGMCRLSNRMQQRIRITRSQADCGQVNGDRLIRAGRITPQHVVIELAGICRRRNLLGIGDNLESSASIAANRCTAAIS